MTKKDRSMAKLYLDWILADVEKRDRAILDLWEQLTKVKIDVNRKLWELRDRKDYEIWVLKSDIKRITALKLKAEWKNTLQKCVMIISLIVNFILLILIFTNGTI